MKTTIRFDKNRRKWVVSFQFNWEAGMIYRHKEDSWEAAYCFGRAVEILRPRIEQILSRNVPLPINGAIEEMSILYGNS